MINFGDLLARAWQIIWKHKVLWIFGILAALAGGESSGLDYRFNIDISNGQTPFGPIDRLFERIPVWLPLILFMLGLVVVAVVIALGTIGRAGLAKGAWQADSGTNSLALGDLFNASLPYFWRVLLLTVIMWAIGMAGILALVLPVIFTLGLALLCLWPIYCLILPLFYGLNILFNLAIVAVVNEDLDVIDALKRAWDISRAHLVEIIVLALILLIGTAVANFVIMLPLSLVVAPIVAALAAGSQGALRGGAAASIAMFLIYLPFLLALRGIVVAYINTTWTVAFRRLTQPAAPVE